MKLRVLTLNIWHGLDGNSSVRMGYLEPKGRQKLRLKDTIEVLKSSGTDIICLQEVNPAPEVSAQLAQTLNFHEIHTLDNTGIRFGKVGLPAPLFCGVTVLASKDLKLKPIESIQLSGPRLSFASDYFCFRPQETRVAIFGIMEKSPWGPLLCVNYHLHHGVELTTNLKASLNNLFKKSLLTEIELKSLFDFCYLARDRRLRELECLRLKLEAICISHNIQNVLMFGDLNCTEESLEWKKVVSWGFADCYRTTNPTDGGFTWNSEINFDNHRYGRNFHFPWPISNIVKSVDKKEELTNIFMQNEFRKRRIDFIFARGPIVQALRKSDLFGHKPQSNGVFISDHFGVVSEFEV